MSIDRVFEEELLVDEISETIKALVKEDQRDPVEIAAVAGLRVANVLAPEPKVGEMLTVRRVAQIAAALGYRFELVPVKFGERGPDWTRSMAAMAATDAALGVALQGDAEARDERADQLRTRIEQTQEGVVADGR